ncbi:hypothetical protein [Lactococcus taiwanensis]|uniref:hypothetical protein n=1 Tax=Lactococcus taiwanensis TaxID=1151742 RepID=UPI0035184782
MEDQKKADRRKKIIGSVLLALLALGVIFGALKYQQSLKNKNSEVEQGTVIYDSKFKSNAPGNLVFPAYTKDIVVKQKDDKLPIVLANPKVNKNVYFQYVLTVEKERGKEYTNIGKSKLIAAGRASNQLQLNKKEMRVVAKGKHKCRLNVYAFTYNKKDNKKIKLNQAYWDFNLTVQ